jgi:Guanosine polyphosphate pyrophosphohydrolases/synthetases
VPLLGVNSLSDKNIQTALITISIEVQDLDTVSKVLTRLRQLKGVTDAKRKQS